MNLDLISINPLLDTLELKKISDEEYFSEKYAEHISNSRLGLINPNQDGTPQKFFDGFAKNKIYSDSLILGSRLHECFLQPEYFEVCDTINRPTSKVGHIADILSHKENINDDDFIKAAIEVDYYSGLITKKRLESLKESIIPYLNLKKEYDILNKKEGVNIVYMDNKMREKFYTCLNNLHSDKQIMKLMNPSYLIEKPMIENEWAILLDVEAKYNNQESVILKLKCKIDNFVICPEDNLMVINDLKTTSKPADDFQTAIQTFRYHREMAFYSWLLAFVLDIHYGIRNPNIQSNFLVIETRNEHSTRVVPMTKKLFKEGFEEFKTLLKMAAYYKLFGYD